MAVFFVCAGLLGVLAAILTLYVGRMRGQKKVFLGDVGESGGAQDVAQYDAQKLAAAEAGQIDG